MGEIVFDLPDTGKVFAIGANAGYLRHFVREFVREGGAPSRVVVIRDARLCPKPLCADIGGIIEHAVEADGLGDVIAALRPPAGSIGCVFAWHRLIPTSVIEALAGGLYNLHYGDLPRYRGAGGGSWQVLNGETDIKSFIHVMTRDLDRGDVLMHESEPFGTDEPYPRHVKDAAARASLRLITRLAALMHAGGSVATAEQDEDAALYFPRLDTAGNGWIDFSWPAADILRFVRAFSDPYPGASFRYRDACYRVRGAKLRSSDALHPFCAGLIVNRTLEGLHVAAKDGVMVFSGLHAEDGVACVPEAFRVGGRLWTSPEDLLSALRLRPGFSMR
ncbi:MAG: formyltransferase family protein [Pseudoxanthomonas sp.]